MDEGHDIRQQIAKYQTLLTTEDDEEIRRGYEKKIVRLQAQLAAEQEQPLPPPPPANVHMSGGTTHGPVTGINYGTVQAFFGVQDKTQLASYASLLANYLDSLVEQYSRLRLGKLLAKDQSGREEATAPALSLLKVYTSLATDCWLPLNNGRFANQTPKTLRDHMDKHNPAQVIPEQVHLPMIIEASRPFPRNGQGMTWAGVRRDLEQRPADAALAGQWCYAESADHAITSHRRLVLLGAPGSGKSTVLRFLTVWLANQLLTNAEKKWPVPLFCQLGRVAKQFTTDPSRDVSCLIEALFAPVEGFGSLRTDLRRHILAAWRGGSALLFLDGLDEVSSIPTESTSGLLSHRERMADAIRRLAEQIGDSRIVVTCRIKPYEQDAAWQLRDPWVVRTLQPFSFGQVRKFIPAWYRQTCASPQAKFMPDEAEQRAERLIGALEQREPLHDLTGSPLLLTMLALLDYNSKQLPEKRVDVYEELVGLLLDRWAEVRSADKPQQVVALGDRLKLPTLTVNDLRPVIYDIAFDAHAMAVDGRGVLSEDAVNAKLDAFFERKLDGTIPRHHRRPECTWRSAEVLHLLSEETGLVQDDGDGQYVLPHLTFEEYLAACHLEYREDVQCAYTCWCESPDRWREVLLLLMGRLVRQNKFSMLLHWFDTLVSERCGTVAKSRSQRQRDAIFAAVCYAEMGRRTYLEDRINVLDLEQRMTTALVEVLEHPAEDMHASQRIEAGFLLGDLGDPRVPVTLEQWQGACDAALTPHPSPDGRGASEPASPSPTGRRGRGDEGMRGIPTPSALHPTPFQEYWCYVPAGTYRIGGWEKKDKSANIVLPAFWIARYPVTVAQYATFIAAGGYATQQWWTPNGWAWNQEVERTQPWGWDNSQYNGNNQAVRGVTWYEAVAFAAWLHAQLASLLPVGWQVRLPTEAEWEAAAAYGAPDAPRHTYPWGEDEPTPERAIYTESGLNSPAPVGCCPTGAAACGALDMAGQVWEFAMSDYAAYPKKSGVVVSDLSGNFSDVPLRGAAYYVNRTSVRCAARLRPPLDSVNYYISGLRLLLSPCFT